MSTAQGTLGNVAPQRTQKSKAAPRRKKPGEGARALTARQAAFVAEYLTDLNATQAAIRAGDSARSAGVHAARLLAKANVAEAVSAGMKARAARVEVRADDVVRELPQARTGPKPQEALPTA